MTTTMIDTSETMPPETEALLRRVEELERTVGALREAAAREPAPRDPVPRDTPVIEARVIEPLSDRDLAAVEERLEERVLERLSTRNSAELEDRLMERLAARVPAATAAPEIAKPAGAPWFDRMNPFKPRAIVPPPVSSRPGCVCGHAQARPASSAA